MSLNRALLPSAVQYLTNNMHFYIVSFMFKEMCILDDIIGHCTKMKRSFGIS